MSGTNPLEQSDEDFLNSSPPVVEDTGGESTPAVEEEHDAGDPIEEAAGDDTSGADPDVGSDGSADEDVGGDDGTGNENPLGNDGSAKPDEAPGAVTESTDGLAKAEPEVEAKPETKVDPKAEATPDTPGVVIGYRVPKSFTANGKTIEIKNEQEAVQLMQMGANYTRKMQELAPHRKVLLMLQNNGLLDEQKLSFLIDLDKKNPEAIQKLIKDAGIDPMEIDTSADSNYLEGSHAVSEEEVGFRTVIEDLSSNPTGKETLAAINTDWDQASKEVLWKQPEIMAVIHEQRESGIYDQIKAEVDRQITVGLLPANTPFLAAYRQVGDQLVAQVTGQAPPGQQPNGTTEGPQAVAKPAPTPVVTRAAAPKAQVKNSDKASAASPTRATPGQAKTVLNPLSMSDEQFMKEMENRV